tara:strand:- start:724 stop:1014 length:291 start_codon:yes stop_codon:yes gene_type:complete
MDLGLNVVARACLAYSNKPFVLVGMVRYVDLRKSRAGSKVLETFALSQLAIRSLYIEHAVGGDGLALGVLKNISPFKTLQGWGKVPGPRLCHYFLR